MIRADRRWLAALPVHEAVLAGHLRCLDGVEVALAGENAWLRGSLAEDDALPAELARLPLIGLFLEGTEGRLFPFRGKVPVERLPGDLRWQPLAEVSRPEPAAAALAGETENLDEQRVPVRTVRNRTHAEPTLLHLKMNAFLEWVNRSPEMRLEPLEFVCSGDGEVLVRGWPLPSAPGTRLIEQDGIAIAAGSSWEPPVPASVLARSCGLKDGDVALFLEDGSWQWVEAAAFRKVTRAAVRLTATALIPDSGNEEEEG